MLIRYQTHSVPHSASDACGRGRWSTRVMVPTARGLGSKVTKFEIGPVPQRWGTRRDAAAFQGCVPAMGSARDIDPIRPASSGR